MMRLSRFAFALLPLSSVASAGSCQKCPDELKNLAQYPPAVSYCSCSYPPCPTTATVTKSTTKTNPPGTVSTTVATDISTVTTGTTISSVVVSTESLFEITTSVSTAFTTTLTSVVPTTTVISSIYTTTVITTLTTDMSSAPVVSKRTAVPLAPVVRLPDQGQSSDCLESLLSSLKEQPESVIQTACSCIETQPPASTGTSTITVTTGGGTVRKSVTDTITSGVESTVSTRVVSTVILSTTIVSTVSTDTTFVTSVATTAFVTTDTTSTKTTVIPSPPCTSGDTGDSDGCTYNVVCDTEASGDNLDVLTDIEDLDTCLVSCSSNYACKEAQYDAAASACTLFASGAVTATSSYEYGIYAVQETCT